MKNYGITTHKPQKKIHQQNVERQNIILYLYKSAKKLTKIQIDHDII